jgi:hypothetical protein
MPSSILLWNLNGYVSDTDEALERVKKRIQEMSRKIKKWVEKIDT